MTNITRARATAYAVEAAATQRLQLELLDSSQKALAVASEHMRQVYHTDVRSVRALPTGTDLLSTDFDALARKRPGTIRGYRLINAAASLAPGRAHLDATREVVIALRRADRNQLSSELHRVSQLIGPEQMRVEDALSLGRRLLRDGSGVLEVMKGIANLR